MFNLDFLLKSALGQFTLMVIVWTIFAILAKILRTKEKYGLTIYPLVILYESDKFNNFIEKEAKRNSRLWSYYAKISGPLSLILIIVALIYFLLNLILLLNNTLFVTSAGISAGTPVIPIIPFITIPSSLFLSLLIGSALAIIPHEIAHGIIAAKEEVPIRSSGIYIIGGVILGGFVRLDEDVEKTLETILTNEESGEQNINNIDIAKLSKKIYRIASAGLLINLILFSVLLGFTSLAFKEDGVIVIDVIDNGPAFKAGIQPNDIIKKINNYTIRNINDLHNALLQLHPNDTAVVYTDRGIITITLGSHPDNSTRAYMGVSLWNFYNFTLFKIDKQLSNSLFLIFTISYVLQITVVFLNALPLYVTDGSKVLLFYMLSKKIKLESAMKVFNMVNLIGFSILFSNLAISLVLFT